MKTVNNLIWRLIKPSIVSTIRTIADYIEESNLTTVEEVVSFLRGYAEEVDQDNGDD